MGARITIPDIKDIEIFDPKKEDEISYATLLKLEEFNQIASGYLRAALHEEALDTPLGYTTLREYLHSPGGYFDTTPGVARVVFVDGKLDSTYTVKAAPLERIAKMHDSVPLCFDREF